MCNDTSSPGKSNTDSNLTPLLPSVLHFDPIKLMPDKRGFKMIAFNIVHLTCHIDELRILMYPQLPDLLVLNESKLDSTVDDEDIKIAGYQIIRYDRTRHGGGVCIYLKSCFSYSDSEYEHLLNPNFEIACIEIKSNSKPFVIVACYRPPKCDNSFFDHLEMIISNLDNDDKEYIILGDLNSDLLPINNCRDSNVRLLKSLIEVFQLTQLITEPTRVTETSKTLLDVIITNKPEKIVTSGTTNLGTSDHDLVYAIRKISKHGGAKPKYITTRQFKHFEISKFRHDLSCLNWHECLESGDIDEVWHFWKSLFLSVANVHAPLRTRRVRKNPAPWMTSKIRQAITERDRLKKLARKNSMPSTWTQFKISRNNVNSTIRKAKKKYYHDELKANKSNPRGVWKVINELKSRKHNDLTINRLEVNNTLTDISNALNKHFVEIGPRLASKVSITTKDFTDYVTPTDALFKFEKISNKTVFDYLSKLSSNKSTGLDNLSCRLLRDAAPVISQSLCNLFNYSLDSGIFPTDWKVAKVFPLHKGNDKNDPNNYRPISVLSAITKIFEKIVYCQLLDHLNANSILSENQSGFRSLHSTATALLHATNEWYEKIDKGLLNGVVFLDLAKAFDTVDHNILLKKLEIHGVRGVSLQWFRSYLYHRSQFCLANNNLSDQHHLSCGVPQGSTLGPLLFLLYINDLPSSVSCSNTRMYADDTSISVAALSSKDIESKLNSDLDKIKIWLEANRLSLNVSKSEFMLVGSSPRLFSLIKTPKIQLGNVPIKQVEFTKSLGVTIDETLSWDKQVDCICAKISKAITGLKLARPFVPQHVLILIYNALVLPLFDYCDVVWGNLNQGLSDRLQKLQNRAARIITKSDYSIRSIDILNKLNWDNLETRRFKHKATLMFKIRNNRAPNYLNRYQQLSQHTHYNLRGQDTDLVLPKPKTEYLKKSFLYDGAKIWNNLPPSTKKSKTILQFRRNLEDASLHP